MKIKALDTYFLSAPLPQPVRTSTSTISRVSELIVTLTTDAGLVGIGEAHGPFLSQGGPEGMRAVGQILERVTPLVVGPGSVQRRAHLAGSLRAHLHERARHPDPGAAAPPARDGHQRHRHRAVGPHGQGDEPARCTRCSAARSARACPPTSPASTIATASAPTICGARRRSISSTAIAPSRSRWRACSPEADAERVGVIRKAVGPDVAIMLDANQGWDLPTAIARLGSARPHDIFWLEDPMPWYDERHALRRLKAEVRRADRGRRDGVHALRAAHDGGRGARRLPDHRLDVGGRAHDVAQGGGHDRALPGAARRPPRSADPRPRRRGEPDRLHPRVVRRSHARSALVRAVPRAAEDRRRLHGGARHARASASSCAGTRSRSTASSSELSALRSLRSRADLPRAASSARTRASTL